MTKKKDSSVEEKLQKNEYVKHKKPKFIRQESWRYKRVNDNWRRPRGIDSKMRKKIKGWPSSPNIGYCSPKKTRGLHPSGFVEINVHNIDDLNDVNPELHAIRISQKVGGRKRAEIMVLAKERGIHILNPRTIAEPEDLRDSIESEEKENLSNGEA